MPGQSSKDSQRADQKGDQRIKNPCYEESMLSQRCIERHADEAETNCRDYFLNYKKCTHFWTKVQRDRRKRGITPMLPAVQDRDSVMEEYKHLLS